MTKREPFVYVVTEVSDGKDFTPEGVETHYLQLRDRGRIIATECDPEVPEAAKECADQTCSAINDAHDKDVREAVEEFRERVVEAIFNQPCGMSMYASSREAEAAQEMRDKIQELVEKLPTEPEEK